MTLELDCIESKKTYNFKDPNGKELPMPIYHVEDDVTGRLVINLKKGKKLEHQGIKVELIGRIGKFYAEINYERVQTSDFLNLSRELEPAGIISDSVSIPFAFTRVEKQFETFIGRFCRLRYFLKAIITKGFTGNIVREKEFAVFIPQSDPGSDAGIKMEVGIEECLHIEFEYNKKNYHLNDCILGKVYFLLVRIRIKYMEIAIIRREIIGAGQAQTHENETVAKFEVMDGAPVRGENIPIRVFLGSFDMSPTLVNVNNKFSVRYYLNLVLVDEEDRRYFKQQEIHLWRKE